MDIGWTHAAPSILAAFFASLVECAEALTIVLAVGSVRGWRSALGLSAHDVDPGCCSPRLTH
jgi:Ca2+/H+ antiporter, TMEM165/GDT1 family